MISLKDVAGRYGLNPATVRQHAKRGKLASVAGKVAEEDAYAYALTQGYQPAEDRTSSPAKVGVRFASKPTRQRTPIDEVPLGRFMLDHMTSAEIDLVLMKIDSHRSRGSGS